MSNLTHSKFLTDSEVKQLNQTLELTLDRVNSRKLNLRDFLLIQTHRHVAGRSAEIVEVNPIRPRDIGKDSISIRAVKRSRDRTIPVPKWLCKMLLDYAHSNNIGESDPIFPITRRHFRRIWASYAPSRAKSSKSSRHSVLARIYRKTSNPRMVQKVGGQRSLENAMIYVDYVEGLKQVRNALSNIWDTKLDDLTSMEEA